VTVTNFLNYVSSGRYLDSIVHRSIPGFVIQGGGYNVSQSSSGATLTPVPTFPSIVNEFGIHNTRGTLAMAKLPGPADGGPPNGGPNSATSQWFINLFDSSANLDFQNGGFTVFGQVIGNGMSVVDAIAALPRVNAGGAFTDLPIVSPPIGGTFQKENLVVVNDIRVVPEPATSVLVGIAVVCAVTGRILMQRRGDAAKRC
jgi:peptidyl-prolyl cis-trans isomerase A (cyclophilin A)